MCTIVLKLHRRHVHVLPGTPRQPAAHPHHNSQQIGCLQTQVFLLPEGLRISTAPLMLMYIALIPID